VTVLGTGANASLSASGSTNTHGVAELHLSSLPTGTYTLGVTLPAAQTSADPVGPAIATTAPVPPRIYRSLEANLTVDGGRIQTASVPVTQRSNGAVSVGKDPTVPVSWQPVWMASPSHDSRRGTARDVVTLIVVHHTEESMDGTLSDFLHGD